MEKLNDIYQELLFWLEHDGKPSPRILHPLFYVYPWGLRFELGLYDLEGTAEYIRSALERGQRIWDTAFEPEDEVLVIFDTTPDRDLKAQLKGCRMQRLRAECASPLPGDSGEPEIRHFYRHLYLGPASAVPFASILRRIVEEQSVTGGLMRYSSQVYFYNRTKKLLFHPYDDRGADLIGPDRETLRPFYESLTQLLLDWNREDMDRKWKVRPVFFRVLTATMDPDRVEGIRKQLMRKLRGAELTQSSFAPYYKTDGWGELLLTIDSTRPLKDIQYRLASKWESDIASPGIRSEIFVPDVEFLWVSE